MKKYRILIVEDETIVAKDIASVLSAYGYAVAETVASGEEALSMVEKLYPNLVLMDINLRGKLDGIQTCIEIGNRFNIPVVFLTAYAEEKTIKKIKKSGGYGYILKPFNENELRVTIELAIYKHNTELEIKKSEEKYRALTENINLGIYRSSPGLSGRFIEVNPALVNLLGYQSKKCLLSIKVSDIYYNPEERKEFIIKLQKYGTLKNEEVFLKKKNGDKILASVSTVAIYNETGRVIYFDGVVEDITERKKAELKIREEASYAIKNPNPVMKIDEQGSIIGANPAAKKGIFFHIIQESIFKIIPEIKKSFIQTLIPLKPKQLTVRIREKVFLLTFNKGWESSNIYIFSTDITETKKIQSALQDSEEKFRAMNAAAQDAIIMIDDSSIVTFWNSAAEKMFDYSKTEIIGKDVLQLLIPSNSYLKIRKRFESFKKNRMHASGKTVELTALKKNGKEINIELSLSACRVKDKWHTIGIVRDISYRKIAEKSLIEAKEMAEAAAKTKSEFLSNMSHEIRTPLNGIVGLTELALNTDLNPTQKEYLSNIKDSTESLKSIINDILDFSKIETGKFDLENIDFNLRESLSHSINTLSIQAQEKGLELICRYGSEVPDKLIGDPGRLRQIIYKLVGNAIKFSSEGAIVLEVTLKDTSKNKVQLSFSIIDKGIGIPEDKQKFIFEAFSQADGSSTRQHGGTGIGLAITSHLVSLMGGQIKVESNIGKGSKFYFNIKFGLQKSSVMKTNVLATEDIIGLHAMIVDDNAINRKIIEELLTGWKLRVSQANNGVSALRKIEELKKEGESLDFIIVDVLMPRMDGFQLAEKIKSIPELSDLPIIIMSSSGQRGDAVKCKKLGISGYLPKPIFQIDLLKAIKTVLGMKKNEQKSNLLVTQHSIREKKEKLKVLLVEDNLINQKFTVKMLEINGFTTRVAANGLEALNILENEKFDLILMDIQMPEMDGVTATLEIRKREIEKDKHIPIIAVTAHTLKDDRERFLAAGMDACIAKPINPQDFFNVIDQVLSFYQQADLYEKLN